MPVLCKSVQAVETLRSSAATVPYKIIDLMSLQPGLDDSISFTEGLNGGSLTVIEVEVRERKIGVRGLSVSGIYSCAYSLSKGGN
jgi:hypothetical protein